MHEMNIVDEVMATHPARRARMAGHGANGSTATVDLLDIETTGLFVPR